MTTSQHKTLAPPPPYRNAVIVIAIAIGMAAIFATSYSLVLGRATPHRITIGLVGSPAEQPALLAALKRATHGGLAFHPYAADAAAEEAIDDQAIYAALVLDQGIPRVLISSASGYSVARVLEMAAEQIELETGLPLTSSTCICCRPPIRRGWSPST